jgi:hypothetical protein
MASPPVRSSINWPLVAGAMLVGFAGLLIYTLFVALPIGPSATPGPSTAVPSSPEPTSSRSPSPSPAEPSPSTSPAPSSASPAPSGSVAPSPAASTSPAASATPTPSPAGADECSGNDDNQEFFDGAADGLPFDVYCAVLPDGWSVAGGEWRDARLEIEYRGPGGASLLLRQGRFCGDIPECLPDGRDVGPAAFGDREGRLLELDDRFAIVVDELPDQAYVAESEGLDEDEITAIGEALLRVE